MSELESCPTCGALPCDWAAGGVGTIPGEAGAGSSHEQAVGNGNGTSQNTSPPQPGEVERLRSTLHGRLWVAYGDGMIGLPSGFHLGSGGEYGDYHYRWRADEGVEYVVFEGGCVWFCAVAIEGRIDTWWQAKSREDAKMSAYRDAGAKDILAALTPSESQSNG